ncbi:MAG: PEGA domain-containing protein [Calditrichaeota bacterium]|nr:PEGA domain-containing protein [Calditrichota bacterium]
MQYEVLPSENIIFTDERSLLIVESTVPKLMFSSNRGIKPGAVEEKTSGVWQVYLEPGVQLVTIMAEGYLPIELERHNYIKSRGWQIKVTPKIEFMKGYGSISIETDPPGAQVEFNEVLLADKTPLILKNQSAGNHTIRLELEKYTIVDTVITVVKDKQTELVLNLQKLAAYTYHISKTSYGIQLFKFRKQKHIHLKGLSLPLISGTGRYEEFTGVDIGLFCAPWPPPSKLLGFIFSQYSFGKREGISSSFAELLNEEVSVSHFRGFAFSFYGSFALNFSGLAIAAASFTFTDNFNGVAIGLYGNIVREKHNGLQVGIFNYAKEMNGIQLGFVNVTRELRGVQIGGICWASNSLFKIPVSVGINVGF